MWRPCRDRPDSSIIPQGSKAPSSPNRFRRQGPLTYSRRRWYTHPASFHFDEEPFFRDSPIPRRRSIACSPLIIGDMRPPINKPSPCQDRRCFGKTRAVPANGWASPGFVWVASAFRSPAHVGPPSGSPKNGPSLLTAILTDDPEWTATDESRVSRIYAGCSESAFPALWVSRTSSTTELTPVFDRMFARWKSTVFGLMPSS